MQLDDLRIFLATVDAGSFTGAADKLLLSKQFVSRRMAALEAALHVRLLNRNTRKLAVTESGQAFYLHAQRILAEVAQAEEAMSARRTELHGSLKISAPMSFGMSHLSPLLAEFLAAHPAVRLEVELSDRRVDLIGEGFDLALRIGQLADSTLVARTLGTLRMIACCSPAYRRSHGEPAAPAELHRHACLLYGQESRDGWEFETPEGRRAYAVQGPLIANNGDVVRDAAIAGLGVAMLPQFIVGPAIASGALVTILAAHATPPLRLSAVYPQHRQGSTAIRTLFAFLEERLVASLEAAPSTALPAKAKATAGVASTRRKR
ncbi:LysR family transcriptional regulator [Burkholderia gladioli]|uniref:LysR family transcriptional regulator n=1 Tax=Burkholderia gladioli TaxID=28095 RepID=UPI00163EB7F2|nr:LysR family transcriptional regulator [Burkholderia gladioli]